MPEYYHLPCAYQRAAIGWPCEGKHLLFAIIEKADQTVIYIYINIHIHILYFVILTVFSLASLRLIGYPLVICSHKDSSKETTNLLCCRTLSAIISTWAKNVVKMKQFCLVLNLTLHRGMPCQGTSAALSHIIIAISSNIIIVNNIINTSSQLNE